MLLPTVAYFGDVVFELFEAIIFFDELVIFIPLYHHTYFSSKYIVASVPEGALIFAPSFNGDDIILGDMPHLGIVVIVVADTSTIEIKENTVAT